MRRLQMCANWFLLCPLCIWLTTTELEGGRLLSLAHSKACGVEFGGNDEVSLAHSKVCWMCGGMDWQFDLKCVSAFIYFAENEKYCF